MPTKVNFSVGDLTKGALQRLVEQLLHASEGEEQKILDQLAQRNESDKERNDLADLVQEKRGKPSTIEADEDVAEVRKRGKA